jgi:ATP-dependent DNA helicase RecG
MGANAAMPADPVEQAVDWLRREWSANCTAGMAFSTARSQTERLRRSAASAQAAAALDEVLARMDGYRRLLPDGRREELPRIANLLKALKPLLAEPATPPVEIGLLERAIAPSRAAAKATAPPRPPARAATNEGPPLLPDDPVTALPRVGPAVAKKLDKLGLRTVGDVLRHAPREHIDYSNTARIGDALAFRPGEQVTLRGTVMDVQLMRGGGPPRVVAKIADGTGWVRVTWFNQYLINQLALGDEIAVSGEPESGYGALSFTNPEWEFVAGPKATGLSTGRLTPVYPLTAGIHQKTLRPLTRAALDRTRTTLSEFVPAWVREADGVPLPGLADAHEMVHYPATWADKEMGERRLAFDDLLLLQIGQLQRRAEREALPGIPMPADPEALAAFRASLPFTLTGAQDGALAEIVADLGRERPMERLVQGDVGSGKTVVAAAAMLVAHANGFQSALMAPTQILAEQHERNLVALYDGLVGGLRPRVALLTGNTKAKQRREIAERLAAGEIHVLVGTHALIEEAVTFARLGLAVVDEQHRFGVNQRAKLLGKAEGAARPHLLSLTATPIPRTLNVVLNGDVEVSVIAERPPGRVPVETRRYVGREREQAYALVREQVAAGRQVFVICPLVEASEASEAKAAVDEAERLQAEVFPDLRIEVLHGRMSGRDKDATMTAFRERGFDLLVSTSVIEVGIDIPNATVMLVEGADRFGLAQLHQFRGRVGRGSDQSWCLLLADESTPVGEERLAMMCATDNGFVLAEKDLELRGPGDFLNGTRQSGLPEMSWLDGSFDSRLLDRARKAAAAILARDPDLAQPDHALLRQRVDAFWQRATAGTAV